jgi:hypothetical protein
VPGTDAQRTARVITALAEEAQSRSTNANDRSVHDDLEGKPAPRRPAAAQDPAAAWQELQAKARALPARAPTAVPDAGPEARLRAAEEWELDRRAAEWAALTGRRASTSGNGSDGGEPAAEAARKETARPEDDRKDVRARERVRGPRM